MTVEDLERRRLLSGAIHTFVNLHAVAASEMISGPDGNLWVAVIANQTNETEAIDRIGPSGSIASFPIPGTALGLNLTVGPNGNIWFVSFSVNPESQSRVVGEVTTAGQVTEFPLPSSAGMSFYATGIVNGPDGDVSFGWFGHLDNGTPQISIAEVTMQGVITLLPVAPAIPTDTLYTVAAGSDGNLWFAADPSTVFYDSVLGRVTPEGAVTLFPIPGHIGGAWVSAGPDGNLIVTGSNKSGRNEAFQVSTDGVFTRYHIPAAVAYAFPDYLTSANGALWFAFGAPDFIIGRIAPGGRANAYNLNDSVRPGDHAIFSMAVTGDGKLFVLDNLYEPRHDVSIIYRLFPSKLH